MEGVWHVCRMFHKFQVKPEELEQQYIPHYASPSLLFECENDLHSDKPTTLPFDSAVNAIKLFNALILCHQEERVTRGVIVSMHTLLRE